MKLSRRSLAIAVSAAVVGTLTFVSIEQRQPATATGCGPTSLYALCRAMDTPVSFHGISARFGKNAAIASFADIKRVGNVCGMTLEGREMTIETMQRHKPLGVLHLDGTHFVAAIGYEAYGVTIADPIGEGQVRVTVWPYAYLKERWDGRILVLTQYRSNRTGLGHNNE